MSRGKEMEKIVRPCPEFPCDNDRVAATTHAEPALRLEPVHAPRDAAPEIVAPAPAPAPAVAEPAARPPCLRAERRARPRPPSPPHDPYLHGLVEAMAEVAGAHEGDVRALLAGGVAGEGVRARLIDAALVGEDGVLRPRLAKELAAWRAIVRGELSVVAEDPSGWSGKMLDDWAAELLASLLGQPALAPSLRTALRARGLCAFGLERAS
ncbi:MAG: hypothetical protein IPF92_01720 [Myxococcales bacterium]|nr:hypothetical protein [Myxococcales bacterium]MBL0193848.1 hypothetical protein [Myxococcales bacterium]HQY65593.1 hypothetical protein [Polyangiaceae bacterium]